MLNNVKNTVEKHNLINEGDTVIVALSGGADSVALLYSLLLISKQYSFTLRAAHLNHNIRGEEAFRDENFCSELCSRLGLPIDIKRVFVKEIARNQKISEELAGRDQRYEFFRELSEKFPNSKVATAHTASDNLETIIFNLSRGTDISGLCGIPFSRGNIIRPLLTSTRAQVELFCRENNLGFVTDSTNLQTEYSRNKIRAFAVPALKSINPDAENTVSRFSQSMCELSAFLDKLADSALKGSEERFGYSCEKLEKNDSVLLKRAVYKLLKDSGITADSRHVNLCCDIIREKNGCVNLPGGFTASAKQGIFRIVDLSGGGKFEPFELSGDCEFDYCGRHYSFLFSDKAPENASCVVALKDTNNLILRTRKPADTVYLNKRKVTKSLKKLLNELKIPQEIRDSLLLLEQNGRILWTEGIGAYYENKPSENNIIFLRITTIHHKDAL